MDNKNEILFPIDASEKHPYTKEVIELAERSGISITKIGEILGWSQSYVSQLKSGKGRAKVSDLEPLISLLSPRLPGDRFYNYTVFREARPILPSDWEQLVLMTGLVAESEQTKEGRYPLGDDDIDTIAKQHHQVLEQLDENGEAYRSFNTYNSPVTTFKRSKVIAERVRESLDTYQAERKKQFDRQTERDEELKHWTVRILNSLPSVEGLSDQAAEIEDALIRYIKPRYEQENEDAHISSYEYGKTELVNVCREAAHVLNLPSLVSDYKQEDYLNSSESDQVLAPAEHAKRLLEKLELYQNSFEENQLDKQQRFRLKGLFKKDCLTKIKDIKITDPRSLPSWGSYGQELFGGMVRKVFRDINTPPYEINLSEAFELWATGLEYDVDEETVQVCGKVFHSEALGDGQLTIHELNSRKFVYLIVFPCKELNRQVTLLSNQLSAIELIEHIKIEAESLNWTEQLPALLSKIKSALSQNGYRVPGIRAVY
ncbi:hypothetical protein TUM4438_25630 [Shewanella sairae]|uniref:HTH cro/C1-type domain-containing protein n=1 Tax=Shewanella sairae TaxID=190310 RepID=A0ABQ4PIF0_9GAMM|nr:helix-turn-helix transcriptional regulator [Shewanella sairae]MCL1131615.1 helix-turn-helix domain-containing protein [Shewanella sairae]GIU47214.1 hypothetical protein TUM4438_25630 [Shewanella sairae]